jgi:enamine deaminase RidA (YjgF/YER057c/UK114 family)
MAGMLHLDYVRAGGLAGHLEKLRGHVLGVVGFGAGAKSAGGTWLDIPVLGDYDGCHEVWSSTAPVTACNTDSIRGASDGAMLFGALQLLQQDGQTLESLSATAYTQIFAFLAQQGYPHLWRIWHYFPQINDDERGLERYRCFNVGRHEAFAVAGRNIDQGSVPAASALGSDSGPLTLYFIAGRHPGAAFENPRQTRAWQYPDQYGPRSPAFARAMLITQGGQRSFFISGTASVVKSESLHAGDVAAQVKETLRNVRVLLEQTDVGAGRMLLKTYLRHAKDLPQVRALVENEFGADCGIVYLRSDICRADLLLEIEGVRFADDA